MASAMPPNILFLLSDDHATTAIGAYAGRLAHHAQTTAIDKLASQGAADATGADAPREGGAR